MTEVPYSPKIKPEHLARKAIVYLRQSSEKQVRQNQESQRLQYLHAARAACFPRAARCVGPRRKGTWRSGCVPWVGSKWRSSIAILDPARPWPPLVGKDS